MLTTIRKHGPAALARVCLVLALAAWLGAVSTTLDGLTHFAPLWLAFCVTSAIACIILDRTAKGWTTFCLAAALGFVALMAPEFLRPAPPAQAVAATSERTIRVVWLNTWLGSRPSEEVLRYLESSDADFLLLAELHGIRRPEFARLRELYPFIIRCESGHQCDTMILAKRAPLEMQRSSDVRLVLGRFDIDGAPLTLISAHIARPNPPGVQQRELANLADIIHSYDRNDVILAGDFNATPWSFSLRRFDTDSGLTRHTRALPTWPAQAWTRLNLPALFAFLPIDHIYSGAAWRPVMVRRGPRTSSDHYPIEATFRYEEAH